MRDGQARAQAGAVAAVEGEKLFRHVIAQGVDGAASDMVAGPAAAQALAFDAQVGDLVQRIDGAQSRVELQAIDDGDRVAEPNVLGPQVAVAVDDSALAHAVSDQPRAAAEKAALRAVDAPDQTGRQSEPRVEQHALVVGEAVVPIAQQSLARDENGAGPPVKRDQRRDHMVELRGGKLAGKNGMFECLAFVEPAHHHQPVDDLVRPADAHALRGACQRHRPPRRRRAPACGSAPIRRGRRLRAWQASNNPDRENAPASSACRPCRRPGRPRTCGSPCAQGRAPGAGKYPACRERRPCRRAKSARRMRLRHSRPPVPAQTVRSWPMCFCQS